MLVYMVRFFLLMSLASLAACAHSPSPAEEGLAAAAETPAPVASPEGNEGMAPAAPVVPAETGPARQPQERCLSLVGEQKIKRSAVDAVISAGLGNWLQGVQIDRVLEGRKFKGWRIAALHLENPCYAAVDLRPGDVVTAINGKGPKLLERPETAQAIFASLRQAPAIEVAYVREQQPRVLRFEIVDDVPREPATTK